MHLFMRVSQCTRFPLSPAAMSAQRTLSALTGLLHVATVFFFYLFIFLLALKTTSEKCEAAFLTFKREETSDAFSCESRFIPYCILVCLHLPEY